MAAVLTLLCVLVQNINHLAKCTFNPALVVLTMTKTCALATSHMHKPNKTIFTVFYLKCWPLYYYVCVCVIEREFGNRNVWSHFDQFDLFPCHGCSERGRKRERKDRQKEKKKPWIKTDLTSVFRHLLVSLKWNCSLAADLYPHLHRKDFMTPKPGQPIENRPWHRSPESMQSVCLSVCLMSIKLCAWLLVTGNLYPWWT